MNSFSKVAISNCLLGMGLIPDETKLDMSDQEASQAPNIKWFAMSTNDQGALIKENSNSSDGKTVMNIPNFTMKDAQMEYPDDLRVKFDELRSKGWVNGYDNVEGWIKPLVPSGSKMDPDVMLEQERQSTPVSEYANGNIQQAGLLSGAWWFVKNLISFTAIIEGYKTVIAPFISKYWDNVRPINKCLYSVRSFYFGDDYSYEDTEYEVSVTSQEDVTRYLNDEADVLNLSPCAATFPWYSYAYSGETFVNRKTGREHSAESYCELKVTTEKTSVLAYRQSIKRSRFNEYAQYMKKKNPLITQFEPLEPMVMELINTNIDPVEFDVIVLGIERIDGSQTSCKCKRLASLSVPGLSRVDLCCYHYATAKGYEGNWLYAMCPDYCGITCLDNTIRAARLVTFD